MTSQEKLMSCWKSLCWLQTPLGAKKHETIGYVEHVQKERNTNIEMTELEERYQEIVDTIKKQPPKKKMKYMTQEIT